MNSFSHPRSSNDPPPSKIRGQLVQALLLGSAVAIVVIACATKTVGKKQEDYFTSGSREADQRALQKMAQSEQLAGSGEGAGEKGVRRAESGLANGGGSGTNRMARVDNKLSLFERLGGESGLSNIVADLMPRLLRDPRINWQRQGVKRGFLQSKSASWEATPENVATLNRHLVQFLALTTGGPAVYEGKDITVVHSGMNIDNTEFDAALGDLKASLDKLRIPNREQKELLAIMETTRPQVVTRR